LPRRAPRRADTPRHAALLGRGLLHRPDAPAAHDHGVLRVLHGRPPGLRLLQPRAPPPPRHTRDDAQALARARLRASRQLLQPIPRLALLPAVLGAVPLLRRTREDNLF